VIDIKNTFWKHVGVLFAGTGASQLLAILAIPWLTRIYEPSDYGTFAAFLSMTMLIGLVSTGRYESAILLPEKEEDAKCLWYLCMFLGTLTGLISLAVFSVLAEPISRLLKNPEIESWLPWLALSIILNASLLTLESWANRKAKYKRMSISRLVLVTLTVTLQISMGKQGVEGGLIIGSLVAQTLCVFVLILITLREVAMECRGKQAIQLIKNMAGQYSSHPTFLIASQGAGALYQQLPVLFISSTFGSAAAGSYGMAMRLISLPTQVLANALGSVFRQQAAEAYQQKGEFRDLFIKTFLAAFSVSFIPFGLLFFYADDLLVYFLGESWELAGKLSQILAILGWVGFFSTPIDKGAIIVGNMKYIITWHLLRLLSLVGGFYVCSHFSMQLLPLIAALSFIGILFYLIDVVVEYKFAKGSG
jgi:O-antigen/teichoic acid export membrane protein